MTLTRCSPPTVRWTRDLNGWASARLAAVPPVALPSRREYLARSTHDASCHASSASTRAGDEDVDPAAQRFGTRAIHAGQRPDPVTGAIMMPIFQTSTYVQDAVGAPREGYDYARVRNPTREALQANLAALENGRYGAAFSSGLAATEAIVKTVLNAGDHLICGADVYGGVDRMLRHVWERFGVDFDFVNTGDLDQVRAAIRPETRLIHVETPSNPTMTITDIA
ncbi:MAG: hypothetical protein F4Z59_02595, partial [Gemmatimonadales bacterium]|nr:hypothetical protein [Gemmatimonadales bacterium]